MMHMHWCPKNAKARGQGLSDSEGPAVGEQGTKQGKGASPAMHACWACVKYVQMNTRCLASPRIAVRCDGCKVTHGRLHVLLPCDGLSQCGEDGGLFTLDKL